MAEATETPPNPNPTPTPPPEPTPPPSQPPSAKDDVPLENRLAEAQRKAEKAQREAEELRKWKEDQEAKTLSEQQKAEKKAKEAEERAIAAESRATKLERSSWVAGAALSEKFVDPSDAASLVDLSSIESQEDAAKAVKDLAERKPHLIGSSAGPTPIGRVARPEDTPEVPLGPDGKPDEKLGLGQELAKNLFGRG